MRSFSLRFSLSDIQRQNAEETFNRVNSFNRGVKETSPELAQNIANLSRSYPTIPKEILPYVALSGVTAEDEMALKLANRAADKIAKQNTKDIVTDVGFFKRGVQGGFLMLDALFQNVSRGFKSAVVAAQETGKSVPGVVGAATLGGLAETFLPGDGQTTANFLNSVYGGGVGSKFKEARDAYGPNEFRLALSEYKKGRPLNLGTGFLPKSIKLQETQTYLDEIRRGSSERDALLKARDVYGTPITQAYDIREDQYKYTTPSGKQINISPGRVAASQMLEPGTTGYSVVSGIIDGVFRLAADPANLALAYGSGVKTAMRTMVSANAKALKATDAGTIFAKTFLPGKTGKYNRALYYGRTIDDVRATGWGQDFGQAIAKLSGDEGMAFLNDIPEFRNVHPAVKEVLLQVDDPIQVWDILEVVAKGGNLEMKHFDNMFNILKQNTTKKVQRELDRIRELSINNVNFGLDAIPARPTVVGEFFNYAAKLMTGKTTDVAPLRKFAGMFLAKDDPARGLLGVGTQLGRNSLFPRHIKRAMQLRPETTMFIGDIGAAAQNADDILKLSFANAKTRGQFVREVLTAETQAELNEVVYRINRAVAKSVGDQNPNLKLDVEDYIKQQENFTAEIEELRSYFSNSAGGSIAFNGAKIKKRVDRFIQDVEAHFKATGVEVKPEDVKRYVFEAVPSMHLLSQASKSFTSQLIDPRDIIQATKAHQTLIGPRDTYLRAWLNKPRQIIDMEWADAFKIPRKALQANARTNRLTLKPKGPIDSLFDNMQNNILKPLWMFRLALALRIAPEEAMRAAFAGKLNFITSPVKRATMLSNKSLGFFGENVRENKVAQYYNNLGEIVFSTPMGVDDLEFLKQVIDVESLKGFQTMDYPAIEKIAKSYLLGTHYTGEVSDYIIAAAINNVNLKTLVKEGVTESKLTTGTRSIQATSAGSIIGYDGKTYESMGEAFVNAGGFSVDLNKTKFIDLGTRGPAEGDVFVSAYKNKEFNLGTRANLEADAQKAGVSIEELINTKLDNLFFEEDTVALLSKNNHAMGTYIDTEGNFMVDVSIALKGENAIDNAVYLGINSFQESIYIDNLELATKAGYGDLVTSDGMLYLYRKQPGAAAADINYDSTIAKEVLQRMYKSNFDALSLKIEDVQGAAKGMPNGGLFSADETYQMSMGETAAVRGLLDNRKDLVENLFIRVNKRTQNELVINPRYWEGLWTEIGELLATDPIVVRLLNLGKEEMIKYLRNTSKGRNLLKEFVERSYNPEDLAFLTDDKALREYLESIEYRVGIAVGNPTAKILDPYTGRELDASMTGRIWWKNKQKVYPKFQVDLSVTENTKLYQFIKNGGFMDGKDWVRYKEHINTFNIKSRGQANQKFYEEFIAMFNKEVNIADLGPSTIPARFDLKHRVSDAGTIIVGDEIKAAGSFDDLYTIDDKLIWNNVLDKGYNLLISKPSNWLNRDPLFRYAFYDNAKELIKFMDEKTTAEFLKGAEIWIDGNKLWDDLLKVAKEPKLENTVTSLEQAETLLKHAAMNEVKTLFYSTSQRHIASDLFSKYVPFPEIWAEVFQTWGKLIVDNPQKFNRARVAIDNGTEARPWDDENGFFSTDPRTGKLMFNYMDVFNVLTLGTFKAIGKMVEASGAKDALPDIVTAPYQTTVLGEDLTEQGIRATAPGFASGLNLVAQNGFAPGFGPLVTLPMKVFLNAMGSGKTLRKFFLGEYESSGQVSEQALPAWAKKFLTWENSPDDDLKRSFSSTAMDLYTAYVLAGQVDQSDPLSVKQGLEKAMKQARTLFVFRGAAQFALPTAVQPRIEVEDKNGTWWGVQTLVNKYQEMLIKNGYDHFEAQKEFITKFGVNPIPLKQPGSYRVGKQPIKENSFFFWLQDDNSELLKATALPNTAYYIYPDKIEDELFYPAYYETRARDITTDEFANYMRHTQAIFEYEKAKEDIRNSGKTKTEQAKDLSLEKQKIEDEYGFDIFNFQGKPQSVTTIELMAELKRWNDYDLTRNSPENKFVQEYLGYRDGLIDTFLNGGTFTYKGETFTVEIEDDKLYYYYKTTDEDGNEVDKRDRVQKTSRTLNGKSAVTQEARRIMTIIWNDLIEDGSKTNFPQLANEVLYYEISPNNSANED